MRNGIAALAVSLLLGLGFVAAEEFFGTIKKIDGTKITVERRKEAKETVVDAGGAKVLKAKFNKEAKTVEVGAALEGGLKNEAVKVGAFAQFVAEGDKVSEIRILEGRKKDK